MNMNIIYFVLLLYWIIYVTIAAPVGKKPVQQEENAEQKVEDSGQWHWADLEYKRYLEEVVKVLESDPVFREKVQNAPEEDIKSGKVAENFDFVNHDVRSKLHEVKRLEIERLRDALQRQIDLNQEVTLPEHIDHQNLDTFEKEDLKKLVAKTMRDLEVLDKRRKEDFKKYEMEKELEYRHKLEKLGDADKEKLKKQHEEEVNKHNQHPQIHHPGSKVQLEEVWKEEDKLPEENFDMKTFFHLHDVNGDGVLDIGELEALFQSELDKAYEKGRPEDDMRERDEDMSRMREHVLKEMDRDKDGLITLDEFLSEQQDPNFEKDEGWKLVEEQAPVYTEEELAKYDKEIRARMGEPMPPAVTPPQKQQVPAEAQQNAQLPSAVVGGGGANQQQAPPPPPADPKQQQPLPPAGNAQHQPVPNLAQQQQQQGSRGDMR